MSFLNGLSSLGKGLVSFGADVLKDEEARQRVPLMNMPEKIEPDTKPKAAVEKSAAPSFVPSADSAAHGNALDAATLGRAHEVYQGLVARGMDPATAIGFAANAVQESRANPATNPGDMGASHGLMQWRDDRHAGYASKFGASTKMDDALDYILHELSGPEARAWQAIQAAPNDPAARAAAVSQFYERPKDTQAEIARRSSIAQRLAAQFLQGGA